MRKWDFADWKDVLPVSVWSVVLDLSSRHGDLLEVLFHVYEDGLGKKIIKRWNPGNHVVRRFLCEAGRSGSVSAFEKIAKILDVSAEFWKEDNSSILEGTLDSWNDKLLMFILQKYEPEISSSIERLLHIRRRHKVLEEHWALISPKTRMTTCVFCTKKTIEILKFRKTMFRALPRTF